LKENRKKRVQIGVQSSSVESSDCKTSLIYILNVNRSFPSSEMAATGHWRTTRPRIPCMAQYTNPGPKYGVPSGLGSAPYGKDKNVTLYQSPGYSIANYWNKNLAKTPGPGPVGYHPDHKFTKNGKAGGPYAYSTWKPYEAKAKVMPGPTDYDITKVNHRAWSKMKGAPTPSLGSRDKGPRMGGGPGPVAYNIDKRHVDKIMNRAPEPPIGIRLKHGGSFKTPGPGTYEDSNVTKYKKGTPPSYTMGPRWREPTARHATPAPNAYTVAPTTRRVKKEAPAFSFGAHHSEYSHAVQTAEDVDGDCEICVLDDYCRDTDAGRGDDCPKVNCKEAWK